MASRHWSTLVNKPRKSGIKLEEGQKSMSTYAEGVGGKSYVCSKLVNITQTISIDFIRFQVRKLTIYTFQ